MKFVPHLLFGVTFCIFFSSSEGNAQVSFPDSLQSRSNYDKSVYFNARATAIKHLDSSLLYTDEAIKFSKMCDCDSLKLASVFNKAYFLYHIGYYDKSIALLQNLESDPTIKRQPYYTFKTFGLLGSVYSIIDEHGEALSYSTKALETALQMEDNILIAESYLDIGYLYSSKSLNEEAKNYLLKSLATYEAHGANEKQKFAVYVALREVAKSYDEFKRYSKLGFDSVNEDDINSRAYLYVTGSTLLMDNNFDLAEAKHQALNGLRLSDSINYIALTKIATYNLGFIELRLGNYNQAISYFETSRDMIENNFNSQSLLLQGLANAYSAKGDFKKASEYKDRIISIKDSIFEQSASQEFAEFDVKFKTEQKDKEIAEQQLEIAKQKNKRNQWVFGSLAALLIVFGLFQWYTNRQKRKKIAVESELEKEQEINDLRSKFLGNIAHEIRTPLTLITGNLNLALENFESKDKAKRNIEIALENSEKVTQDANEILELLKFEKNKTTTNKVPTYLENTIKRMVLSFSSLAEMKQLNLTYRSSIAPNYKTELDLEKTEKIINNLISNAIKYSSSNKDITVTAAVHNETLRLEVADFGPGIHLDEKEKIFERFYQSEKNKTVGGIGIGLSLSREFAELLQGQLKVTSELHKGSTFTLTLPVPNIEKSAAVPSTPSPQVMESIPSTGEKLESDGAIHKPKILIAEDHPQMAAYLEEILSESYHCTLAFDGSEALQKMKNETFDLITSDIMMPKIDGFQFREKLNENPAYRSIPFILISAKTLEDDKIRGFKLGIDDYIVKPFNKNELIARIDNLLAHKKSRDAWQRQNKSLVGDTESSDQKLLKTIENLVIENMSNEHYKINELAEGVNYSQRQLTRIMKQYCGMTPVQFILEIRLQKAYQLLQHKSFFTLSEVRYDVGITSSSYFNKKFKERFGINPSELLS